MPRLPEPGKDAGSWGDILNDYLGTTLATDGTLKPDTVGATQLKPSSVTNAALAPAAIAEDKLSSAVQTKLNATTTPPVTSVATKTGDVTLDKNDVGLSNVDNTSDANKPVSTATQTALNAKADTTALTSGLAGKADTSALTSGLATKADTSALTSGLSGKVDTSSVGAISGIASLDTNAKLPENQLPTRLGESELNNTFVSHPGTNDLWNLGDSISAQGYTAPTATNGPYFGSLSYLMWASLLSGGRLRIGGVAATSGYTAAQIRASHLPTVLAARPRYCVVAAGTNGGTSRAQDKADLTAIYEALIAAGVTPIACSIPPRSSEGTVTIANIQAFNMWIREEAARLSIPFSDNYAAVVDTSTGLYVAGNTYDGTHPSNTGAALMGQAIVDSLSAVILALPNPPLPVASVWQNLAVPTNVLNKIWNTTRPTGWNVVTSMSVAQVAMTPDEGLGYWAEHSATGTPNPTGNAQTATEFQLVPGNRCLFGFRVKGESVASSGAQLTVRVKPQSGSNWAARFDIDGHDFANGVALIEFDVPVSLPTPTLCEIDIVISATGATFGMGQWLLADLTALGVA